MSLREWTSDQDAYQENGMGMHIDLLNRLPVTPQALFRCHRTGKYNGQEKERLKR